jgi:ribA/ribD-fused uncharacterized protein
MRITATSFNVQAAPIDDYNWEPLEAKAARGRLEAFGLESHYIDLTMRGGPQAVDSAIAFLERKQRHEKQPASASARADNTVVFYSQKSPRTGVFSNFSAHPFNVLGKQWPTSESLFQALKFVTTDPQQAEAIRTAKTPGDCAELGRDRSKKLRPDWETVKDDVMRLAVLAKFSGNSEAKATLLATGSAQLVEDAPFDAYWGTGSGKGGGGKNMLGKILVETRDILRKPASVEAYKTQLIKKLGLAQ